MEHEGIIQFEAISYFAIFDFGKKGDPNLEAIHQFDKMGYDLITESTFCFHFKKRNDGSKFEYIDEAMRK